MSQSPGFALRWHFMIGAERYVNLQYFAWGCWRECPKVCPAHRHPLWNPGGLVRSGGQKTTEEHCLVLQKGKTIQEEAALATGAKKLCVSGGASESAFLPTGIGLGSGARTMEHASSPVPIKRVRDAEGLLDARGVCSVLGCQAAM